jgi:S-DNA-T family DNA segregation ATPase FtsK/SpoIIIE
MIINLNKLRQSFTSTVQNKIKENILTTKTVSLQETRTFTLSNPSSVKSFLATRQEGIFGFEYYNSLGTVKNHFFTADQSHINLPSTAPIILDYTRNDIDCYYLTFRNHSFAPFIFNYQSNFWEVLTKYTRGINKGGIYLQTTFNPLLSDKWKDDLYDMYNAYLDGITHPSTNQMLLKWQYKIHELVKGKRNPPIREFSQKVEQNGYSVCVRLIIKGNEIERKRIKERIKLALSNLNYINGFHFEEVKNKPVFLENMQTRQFNKKYSHQIMCSSEMVGFFGGMSISETEEVKNVLMPKPKIPIEQITEDVEILPSVNQKVFTESDKQTVDELTAAMLRVGLLKDAKDMVVTEVREGTTLKFVEFLRPEYMYLNKIKPRLPDIELEMNVEGINISAGQEKGTVCLSYPRENRTFVDLGDILNSKEFNLYANQKTLPIILGVDMNGNPMLYDLVDLVHLLIAGTTGSGKSEGVTSLLVTLCWMLSPEELEFYLIDAKKGVELGQFKHLPHVKRFAPDFNKAVSVLQYLVKETAKRYEKFEEVGLRNIKQYNERFPNDKMNYKVCVIDEWAELIMRNADVEELAVSICQLSRAAGIHLIMATQRPEKDVVRGLIKDNMPAKIAFACSNDFHYRTVFGSSIPPYRLIGKGDGVINWAGNGINHPFVRFQGARNNDEGIFDEIIRKWGNHEWEEAESEQQHEQDTEDQYEDVNEKFLLLKKVICETGETRNRQLRMAVGNQLTPNEISDYLQQLVDEGWLEKNGNRFKLKLTDIEREIYLDSINEEE